MESDENTPEIIKKIVKTERNDPKKLFRFFKYMGYVKKAEQYDDFFKEHIRIPFLEFIIQVLIIRPIVILFCLFCLSANATPQLILLAEGISIMWFLFIELKRELWRKNE